MNVNTRLLDELIRLKPVSNDICAVNRAEDHMKEYLESNGLFCKMEIINDRHVLYASTVSGQTPDYLFNAHMDVVPGTEEQFIPRIDGDRMYGRGTADCLGSCVVIADALIELKEKASCGAFFTADEEIGGHTTHGMVKLGYKANKCIIIVDAMYDKLAYAQKGMISVDLIKRSVTGGGHASCPWEFDNPIDKLIDGYVRLRSCWVNPTKEEQWSNSMTPCVFSAGSVHNQIPCEAVLTLNIRYVNPEDKDIILARIKELTGCDEVRPIEICPPVVNDADAPIVQILLGVMSEHFGKKIELARMNGATDARHFAELNMPLAMIGVGGEGEHSPCEFVSIASLDKVSRILQDFALK